MTPADRTGSRAERFSTAMRRPATVALLLAFALIAAACEDAAQEAPGAATGTPGATGAEPGEAGQTLPSSTWAPGRQRRSRYRSVRRSST